MRIRTRNCTRTAPGEPKLWTKRRSPRRRRQDWLCQASRCYVRQRWALQYSCSIGGKAIPAPAWLKLSQAAWAAMSWLALSARAARAAGLAPRCRAEALGKRCFRRVTSARASMAVEERQSAEAATTSAQPSYRAYLDFKHIRDNADAIKQNCQRRKAAVDIDAVVRQYEEYLQLTAQVDALRAKRNDNSKAMKGKLDQETRNKLIEEGKRLKDDIASLEERLRAAENELQLEAQKIPNGTHPDVPTGGEENAAVLMEVGAPRQFEFPIKNHVEVGEALGLVDFDRGAEVSGSKFYYMKGMGALLELALINYAMAKCLAKGFVPYTTPDLVRASVMEKCGFQPRGDSTQIYSVAGSDLCLTGTAEVPLGGVYMDQTLDEAQLPIRMCAFGHCFRTEAGAAGMAGKGLYRVHQFSKVEMFVVCTPEQSDALHQELLELEREMFADLGLHFKILDMPTHDLGAPAYRKFDVEAWMPGLERYGEISSASNCTDYQSRRLNIRYRPASEAADPKRAKTQFVHTLNATAVAVPRMMVAILENFQEADGTVNIPEALRPYLPGNPAKISPSK